MPSHQSFLAVFLILMMPTAWAADSTTPTPAGVATEVAVSVVFGIITIASDGHSFTMADAKGGTITLCISGQTAITRDQNKAALAKLVLDQQVRVTYQGNVALNIDQLSAGKKKKKKTL